MSNCMLLIQGHTNLAKRMVFWIPVLAVALLPAAAQETAASKRGPAGKWEGSVTLPSAPLEFQVEIWKQDGAWGGAISVPAQKLDRFPLSNIGVEGDSVTFAMRGVPGGPVFKGKISSTGDAIEGESTQAGRTLPFKLTWKGEVSPPAKPPSVDPETARPFLGSWEGKLATPGGDLRLRINLKRTDSGSVECTLDSLDQGQTGLPVPDIRIEGKKVSLTLNYIRASYEGSLSEDGAEIAGNWKQGGGELPLTLRRPGTGEKKD